MEFREPQQGKAVMNRQAKPAESVANDPNLPLEETFKCIASERSLREALLQAPDSCLASALIDGGSGRNGQIPC
jgi:hypothetical protein